MMNPRRLHLMDFDSSDRLLLRSALKAGYSYAKVRRGPTGFWVAAVSAKAPVSLPTSRRRINAALTRFDEIEGLVTNQADRA
jgi:hypothetical protein